MYIGLPLVLSLPFDFLYAPSRYYFLNTLWRLTFPLQVSGAGLVTHSWAQRLMKACQASDALVSGARGRIVWATQSPFWTERVARCCLCWPPF